METFAAIKDIPAVILCGGLGTRLRPVVSDRPKSMALIASRPFLEYQIGWLRDNGIEDVVLCTGYLGEAIRDHFGNGSHFGLSVRYSREREPLGTAGALKDSEDFIKADTFLVLNGDSAVEVDLGGLLAEHKRRNSAATLTVAKSDRTDRYGQVQLDRENRVTAFSEKRASESQVSSAWGWINGGVYVFERIVLSLIPPAPPAVSLETFLLPELIGKGLHGFRSEGYFIDIGVPEDLERAQEELPRRYGYVHAHTR